MESKSLDFIGLEIPRVYLISIGDRICYSNHQGGAVYPYYYKGGEIHCLKYGSFHNDTERLLALMAEEEKFIMGQHRNLRVWIDLYETNVNEEVREALLASLKRMEFRIVKLALMGCSFTTKMKLKKAIRKYPGKIDITIKYFADPEVGKTWLVSDE